MVVSGWSAQTWSSAATSSGPGTLPSTVRTATTTSTPGSDGDELHGSGELGR